jgi:RNA polymerase sigma factor (sigma-70 family)
MQKTKEEFHAMMEQVMAGSETAAEEFLRDYEPYLLHVIRRRLSKRVRSKFDSLDVAQDVWKSFFALLPEDRAFKSPADLIAFLTKLARHKVIDATRHRVSVGKRDIDREQSLNDSKTLGKIDLAGADRTASQILMSREAWTEFLAKQPLVYRHIFIKLREGKTNGEIAQELKLSTKTVQRVVGNFLAGATT